jgi:hypothetical protein
MPVAFRAADTRPPICSDYIGQTAVSMRALQLYAPKADKAAYDQAVQLAASWMAKAQSPKNDDRSFRLLGLAWYGKDKDATQKAMRELLAKQRPDGGWSDLETMVSSAYATGKSLVAWQTAGQRASDAYQSAVKFLLNTQQDGGSWYVKTRGAAILRCRLPSRLRSVDFSRRDKLGDDGALAGVPGAHGDGLERAMEFSVTSLALSASTRSRSRSTVPSTSSWP